MDKNYLHQKTHYSVLELATLIKKLVQEDPLCGNPISLVGVITSCKSFNNWIFIDLKDTQESDQFVTVVWAKNSPNYKEHFQNNAIESFKIGTRVTINGQIQIWKGIKFHFYVIKIVNLEQELEAKKRKLVSLQQGGYTNQKRNMPFLPANIAIITSQAGAVLHDIDNVFKNSDVSGLLNWQVFDCLVQGEAAPNSITAAIAKAQITPFDNGKLANILIITRGGGGIEDLKAYDHEKVYEAVFNSAIFTLVAVGHEKDWSLSCHLADLSCPTPSVAAQAVLKQLLIALEDYASCSVTIADVFENQYLRKNVDIVTSLTRNKIWNIINIKFIEFQKDIVNHKYKLFNINLQRCHDNFNQLKYHPMWNIINIKFIEFKTNLVNDTSQLLNFFKNQIEQPVCELKKSLINVVTKNHDQRNQIIETALLKLNVFDYQKTLARGFAVVWNGTNIITNVKNLTPAMQINVELNDGMIYTNIIKVEKKD